jgi:hypothetical protein
VKIPPRVEPGESLTAYKWNQLVDAIKWFDRKPVIYRDAGYGGVAEEIFETPEPNLLGKWIKVVEPGRVVIRVHIDVASNGSNDIFVGSLDFGSIYFPPGEVHWQGAGRATVSQEWAVDVKDPGTYLVRVPLKKIGNANYMEFYPQHSAFVVESYVIE